MLAQYKKYASDLYKIKLGILGTPDDNKHSLRGYLQKVNNLRPLLRNELNRLTEEYLSALPSINSAIIEEIREVNSLIMRKLTAFANQLKRKLKI